MTASIEVLCEAFSEWLQIHDLDYDFWVYTGEEWRDRGDKVLENADAVIAFENQLVSILNYTGPWEVEDELQALAGEFGYYFEIGQHWNIGFYSLEDAESWPSHRAPSQASQMGGEAAAGPPTRGCAM